MARMEAAFDAAFGGALNPLYCLGALGWFFFWIASATGIYLYIFFDTGIDAAYESVERLTHGQWYLGGIMRSLHRYASDALVVVVVVHLLREYSLDRLRGRRFFAWLSGVPLLAFIYACGISGYWLVWDRLAQFIAIRTTEWLDALPLFAEPVANNFFNGAALGDRFFTLLVFIHIFAPLGLLLMMWVHVSRLANARLNPPRPLMLGCGASLVGISVLRPALSQAAADLDVVPADVGLDWFYLGAYPLLDFVPGGWLWVALLLATLILLAAPWLPPLRPAPAAVVNLDSCNGCARCFDDCPYGAIEMQPRSDGSRYSLEAVVRDELCLACGLCFGACPTATPFRRSGPAVAGIELPTFGVQALRSAVEDAAAAAGGGQRLVFACERRLEAAPPGDGSVIAVPCVGALPPSFVDFALSRKLAGEVLIAGCREADCFYRLGGEWTRQRIERQRDPYLRQRVPRDRVRVDWNGR